MTEDTANDREGNTYSDQPRQVHGAGADARGRAAEP